MTASTITTAPAFTAPRIGDTGWRITGKTADGGICDHCGRTLTHCYTVTDPNGETMTVGRGCVKKLTGWTLTAKEAARLIWLAEREALRAANWSAFTAVHADAAAEIDADAHTIAAASYVRFDIADGQVTGWELEHARRYLAGR